MKQGCSLVVPGIPDVILESPFAVSLTGELYMRNSGRFTGITAVEFDGTFAVAGHFVGMKLFAAFWSVDWSCLPETIMRRFMDHCCCMRCFAYFLLQ